MTTPDDQENLSLLSWLHNVADEHGAVEALGPATVPVVWVGRTSTEDMQDPTLSLPRQLSKSRAALPDGFVIVGHFYDVESGRTAMELRGHGDRHKKFDIPIPRDGGIADLLAEAKRPDRRFVAVVCESVERIARTTYLGTKIEYELEQAGVVLLAADEGIDRTTIPALAAGAQPVKRATPTLTRRVKQAVAEWYVLNMLELSWGGFKAHTEQGFNIGKPPYGYRAERMRHPVKAKALEGKMKHRLSPDPLQGPVVTQIFQWRALDRLSYRAIAERLNLDLDRYPPPEPIVRDTHRRLGVWTQNNVREVLDNPKHTGYMVWNRRKNPRPERGVSGRVNPPSQWVWSSRPTHEPLVTRALFEAASTIGRFRKGSRPGSGANSHPQTARTYLMRSYLFCDLCGRRTFGSTRKQYTYYRCTPNPRYHENHSWFASHPASVLVREDLLLEPLAAFFKTRVFGEHRKILLADSMAAPTHHPELDTERQTLLAQVAELKRKRQNLVHELQSYQPTGDDDIDNAWRSSLREQFAASVTQERPLTAKLAAIARRQEETAGPDLTLFDTLPLTSIDVTQLPEEDQRELYNAFGLEVRYNALRREVTLRIKLDGETAPMLAANINKTVQKIGQRVAPETGAPGVEANTSAPDGSVCDGSRGLPGAQSKHFALMGDCAAPISCHLSKAAPGFV